MPPRVVSPLRSRVPRALVLSALLGAGVTASVDAAEVKVGPDGSVALVEGPDIRATLQPETPALRRGTPRFRAVEVQRHAVWEVRLPVRGTESEEVWLGEVPAKGGAWTVMWHGVDGPRDADAESAVHVEVSPGALWRYQTSPAINRCDDVEARLFPEAWDFGSHRFRPVVAPLPPPAAQSLVAELGAAATPQGRPRGGFRWTAASTTASAGTDARNLLAPRELDDDDPRTVWSEGLGGDGRGEFLTARTNGGRLNVTGLRIVLGNGEDPAALRKENRVRKLSLILGPGEDGRFDVTLPERQAAKGPLPPYWVALPRPVETDCVTVILTEVAPGTAAARGGGTTSLGALDVFTDVDGPDAARRLVERLVKAGASCVAAVPLVVGEGRGALPVLAEELGRARPPVRACLLEAAARIPGHGEEPLLAEALLASVLGASEEEERILARAFEERPEGVIAGLASLLGRADAATADRARAARLLGGIAQPAARKALLAAAGLGDAELRLAVVAAISGAKDVTLEEVAKAFEAQGSLAARADLLRILPALFDRTPTSAESLSWLPALSRAAASGPASEETFELRARAIVALGHLDTSGSLDVLAQLLAHEQDPVLRYFAVRELVHRAPASLAALRLALADADPRVRETAAEGLGLFRDAGAADMLVAAAKNEGWPFARRAEVSALGRLCVPSTFYLLERAVDRDTDDIARAALQGLAHCPDARVHELLWRKLRAPDASPPVREQAAALLADKRGAGATDAAALAALIPSLVREAEKDDAVAGVVDAAVRSLAALGGPEATRVALALAEDRKHGYRGVAVEALAHLCDAAAVAWLSRAAVSTTDPIAEAAGRGLRRCGAGGAAAPAPR